MLRTSADGRKDRNFISMTKPATKSGFSAIARAKLSSSGLSEADARTLQIKELDALSVVDLGPPFELRPALYLPYFDPLTGDPLGDPPFFRLRYLSNPASEFGEDTSVTYAASGKARKARRYAQPAHSGVYAYFPPGFVAWPDVLADPDTPIFITEGELKAAKGCAAGFAVIGLGGVDSFGQRRRGVSLLPELEAIMWVKRLVYIVYDSDAATNPDVKRAMLRLGSTLAARGARTFELKLPDVVEDGKTGLDDYLVAGHDLEALLENLDETPLADYQQLFRLNDEVALIRDLNSVVDQRTQKIMKLDAFATAYAPLRFTRRRMNAKKEVVEEVVAATAEWIRWPLRTEAGTVTYLPQAVGATIERVIPHPSGDPSLSQYNIWPGWACAPSSEPCPLFLQLIDHLFTGAPREARDWFLKWLAYPIQFPGAKMYSAAVLWSLKTGVGKSLVGDVMSRIYGQNYGKIGNRQLTSSFNEWAARRQFILGDEITGSEKRDLADLLKDMITQTVVEINQKHISTYVIPDCLNYLFTSNHPDAFLIDEDDRRMFVHEITVGPLPDEFYAEFTLQLASQVGPDCPGSILNYLLHLNLDGFGAAERAPMTTSKRSMIDASRPDVDSWALMLRDDPDGVLAVDRVAARADVWTSRDLLAVYDSDGRTRVTPVRLGMALQKAGFKQVHEGQPVTGKDGKLARFYAIRNADRWLSATPGEITAHLRGEAPGAKSTGKVASINSRVKRRY